MDWKDILWNPRMTHQLVRDKVLSGSELVLVDVGMRGGIQQHWTMFNDQLRVIGIEPDEAECRRINSAQTAWKQVCFPVFLDSMPRERGMYQRAHNRAADGLHPNRSGGQRFGIPQDNNWAAAGRITQQIQNMHVTDQVNQPEPPSTAFVKTTTYEKFSDDNGLPPPDFMKVDVEGAEYDVLRGAERFLGPDGLFGLEVEVRIAPLMDAPSFTEVCQYLASRGYHPYNMSLTRCSRNALPLEPDGDHRDHLGNPMLGGPTQRGQIVFGDFVFFRDTIVDNVMSPMRILKCAAVLEIYNLPDCAAELLIYYRNLLSSHINVDEYLSRLIPDVFERPLPHSQYIDIYKKRFGRLGSPSPSILAMRRRYNWISGYVDLAARRGYGRANTLLQHIVFGPPRLARHYLVDVPSLFYHRRIEERAHYFFVGIPSLLYRRKLKPVLGYVELAGRRSHGRIKVALWHVMVRIPQRAVGVLSLFYHRRVEERAHYFFVGIPSLFYHRRIEERAHYFFVGIPSLFYHRNIYPFFVGIPSLFYRRKLKPVLGYAELAARRSYGHTKVALWHILIGIPRRAYQSISMRGGMRDSAIKQTPHEPIG